MVKNPIVYIIFNRPSHTRKTFASIQAQRPEKLFIIADGPRIGHQTDIERCREVRQIVAHIDWPCEVFRNYSDYNLGCKQRVITGLNWVFSKSEQAIILEDDCLPHPDFYDFCDVLLEYYKNDYRVMTITGNNVQNGRYRGNAAYYFSKYNHVWGWATWKRAWEKNESEIPFWPKWRESETWLNHTPDKLERRYWATIFDRMYQNEIDTWDYPWTASIWYYGGLTATPNVNLVTNIGFGPDGTHTVAKKDQDGHPVYPLGVLTHPHKVEQDQDADEYDFYYNFGGIYQHWYRKVLRLPLWLAKKLYCVISQYKKSNVF